MPQSGHEGYDLVYHGADGYYWAVVRLSTGESVGLANRSEDIAAVVERDRFWLAREAARQLVRDSAQPPSNVGQGPTLAEAP